MNIVSISKINFLDDSCEYVGRSSKVLGLANPWSTKNHIHARFRIDSEQQCKDNYRQWFINTVVANYCRGCGTWGLQDWEKRYLQMAVRVAQGLKAGIVVTLVTHEDINIENYIPVPDGLERFDVEILIKGLVKLMDHIK